MPYITTLTHEDTMRSWTPSDIDRALADLIAKTLDQDKYDTISWRAAEGESIHDGVRLRRFIAEELSRRTGQALAWTLEGDHWNLNLR
jgi:hypothetical protein